MSTHVGASDASLEGLGVCSAQWPREAVMRHGRIPERGRFRRTSGHSARDAWFAPNGFTRDSETALWRPLLDSESFSHLDWERVSDFPEIPKTLLGSELFTVRIAQPFRIREDIFVVEARALFRSLQMLVSVHHVENSRCLLLVDNLGIALSFERKRSRHFKVLVQIRKFCAYCLTFNIRCSIRWVPSEWNCSDMPSRVF